MASESVAETERWFIRRGLPHFIHRYSATEDIFTRTLPALVAIAVLEVALNAPKSSFPLWLDALAVLGAFALLVGAWALANVLRGRSAMSHPDRVGVAELTIFVVVPAVVPLLGGGQWRSAMVTMALNLVLLAAVFVVTSYGLVPMARWAVGHGADQVFSAVNVLLRALPVLLLIVIVVFLNTEAWQVASELEWIGVAIVVGTFAVVGTAFAAIRVPRQISRFSQEPWTEVRERVRKTPAGPLVAELGAEPPPPPRLSRNEWGNVGLVVLVSEGILVLIVASMMFGFLVVFGAAAIHRDVVTVWLGHAPDVLLSLDLGTQEMVVTGELIKVSAFLAGFCGLSFTVSLLTDAGYQEEFLAELDDEIADAFAVRAVYREVVDSPVASTMSPT